MVSQKLGYIGIKGIEPAEYISAVDMDSPPTPLLTEIFDDRPPGMGQRPCYTGDIGYGTRDISHILGRSINPCMTRIHN